MFAVTRLVTQQLRVAAIFKVLRETRLKAIQAEELGVDTPEITHGFHRLNQLASRNKAVTNKGGRPTKDSDDWAYNEVRIKGRYKPEVFEQWKTMDNNRYLKDQEGSFNKGLKRAEERALKNS
jgi:hypothetical protein